MIGRARPSRAALLLTAVLFCCPALGAEAAAGPSAANRTALVVLDTMGFWRMHHELRPPTIQMDDGLRPALTPQSWMNRETPPVPAGWAAVDFDDSAWFRGTAPRAIKSPWLNRLCLRGKFLVSEPEAVAGLTLSIDYHGGIVVRVNGAELCRRNLPTGPLGPDALAEPYVPAAFVDDQNQMLFPGNIRWRYPGRDQDFWKDRQMSAESLRRMELWRRSTGDLAIPSSMLRKGVNVLAIKVIRSPYDQAVEATRRNVPEKFQQYGYQVFLATCEIERVRLTAAGPRGIASAAVRPPGLQVWNSDPAAPDFDLDFGDSAEPLRPIAITAPRNGTASGKVVVGSTTPLRGLRASASDLRGPSGTIAAANVGIRYALPWGNEDIGEGLRRAPYPYPHPATPLACLSEVAPEVIPLAAKDYPPYDPRPVMGAVAGVWVTVTVPPETAAGTYESVVQVEVEGASPVRVPLRVRVVDWRAPSPKDLTAWVDMIQSPDTLALEYGLELWSPRHWEMIERSLALLGQVGNRTLYVPLIAHTNLGNAESMVRWARKGPDQYQADFTILDRYLDAALEHMGTPAVIVCDVWELYMLDESGKLSADETYSGTRKIRHERMPENVREHGGRIGLGPLVTVVDPATGKTENMYLPRYGEAQAKAMWAPVLSGLRKRLADRGLEKAMMLGLCSDAWASKDEVRFFNDLLPGVPWVVQSHDGFPKPESTLLHGIAKVGYQTRVWGVSFADGDRHDPWRVNVGQAGAAGSATLGYGWRQSERIALFERFSLSDFPATRWRYFAEVNVTGGQTGFGRVGADLWAVIKDKSGRRQGFAYDRYSESHWRNLQIQTSALAPGPAGPCATHRFEALREGLVECQGRIAIEKALLSDELKAKLGQPLADRCRQALDERLKLMWYTLSNFQMHAGGYDSSVQYATGWRYAPGIYGQTWFIGSDWQVRREALFALAGEVQKRLGQ